MYVGGLGAAAGGTTSFVGQAPAVDAPPRQAPYELDQIAPRAASGAARGRFEIPLDAGSAALPLQSRRRRATVVAQLATIDLVAGALATSLAFWTRFGATTDGATTSLVAALLLPVAWVSSAAAAGAYDVRFVGAGSTEYGRLGRAFAQLTVVTVFVSYAAHLDLARGYVLLALPLALVASCVGRRGARMRLHRLRRAGRAMNRVLVVGQAASVEALAAAMRRDLTAGLHVVAACLPTAEYEDPGIRRRLMEQDIPVVGDMTCVRDAVLQAGARNVAVVAGDVGTDALRHLSWELESTDADLIVSSGLTEVAGQRVHVQSMAGLPLLRVDSPRLGGLRPALKGMFDRIVAGLALVALSPVLIVLGLLVRLTSHGPAFYLQERVGKRGKPFRMVKFRSMYVGADAQVEQLREQNDNADGLLFKVKDDPRVTPLGRWLRRFSLDEVPQLLNIVGGSMSLVGPRPPLPREVEQYGDDVRRRLLVKPGLTGLWQVNGRSDLSWEEAVRLDLHYVENWSFALDIAVLVKTAQVVVKAKGAY